MLKIGGVLGISLLRADVVVDLGRISIYCSFGVM